MKTPHAVTVLLYDQVNAMDVVGPIEVLTTARDDVGKPAYTVETVAMDERVVRAESGLALCADRTLSDAKLGQTLLLPGGNGVRRAETLKQIADWLSRHHERFDRVISICTGAYALAEAGLGSGRRITTHWAHAADLQKRYPAIKVDADALFQIDGRFWSSGGVAAGIDLALELVARDVGSRAAVSVAREMVVFLRRSGSQAQFSVPLQMQAKAPPDLAEVCIWAANNLNKDLSVETLADRAGLSARQFSRRFNTALGTSPAQFVKRLRLDAGRSLLGDGISPAQTAEAVGFASVEGFRRAFEDRFQVTPNEYRNRFQQLERGS